MSRLPMVLHVVAVGIICQTEKHALAMVTCKKKSNDTDKPAI